MPDHPHTSEPWDWDEAETPFYNDAEGNSRGGESAGYAEIFANEGDILVCDCRLSDAPRIVACVNALKGIDTTILETMGEGGIAKVAEAGSKALPFLEMLTDHDIGNEILYMSPDTKEVLAQLAAALRALGVEG